MEAAGAVGMTTAMVVVAMGAVEAARRDPRALTAAARGSCRGRRAR